LFFGVQRNRYNFGNVIKSFGFGQVGTQYFAQVYAYIHASFVFQLVDEVLHLALFLKCVQSCGICQLRPTPEDLIQRAVGHQVVIGFGQVVQAVRADNFFVFK
jgi:hypothetical protein